MRLLVVGLLASAIASPVAAQSANTMVSVKATGSWEMICHISTRSGEDVAILDAAQSTLSRPDLYRASCDSSSSARGPLVVTVAGSSAVCPFKEAAAGKCERSFKSGAASFIVKTK